MIDQSSDRRDAFRQRLKQVEAFLTPALTPLGLEVICIEQTGAARRAVLRISIDRVSAPGTVSVEDCATASRLFQDAPELDALFSGPWDLEFSSPGVDRPLVRPADYVRYVGERVVVHTDEALAGRTKFSGRLTGLVDGLVGVDAGREGQFSIPLPLIRKAHLKPDFADLLKRAEARNPQPELMLAEEEEEPGAEAAESPKAGVEAAVSTARAPAPARRSPGSGAQAGHPSGAKPGQSLAQHSSARHSSARHSSTQGEALEKPGSGGRSKRNPGRRDRFGGAAASSRTHAVDVVPLGEQGEDEA